MSRITSHAPRSSSAGSADAGPVNGSAGSALSAALTGAIATEAEPIFGADLLAEGARVTSRAYALPHRRARPLVEGKTYYFKSSLTPPTALYVP